MSAESEGIYLWHSLHFHKADVTLGNRMKLQGIADQPRFVKKCPTVWQSNFSDQQHGIQQQKFDCQTTWTCGRLHKGRV